jgi:glutathione synthase/RimK-type ligase-like ATP-grasp enzyme
VGKETRTLGLISSPIVTNWEKGEKSFGYEARRLIRAGRDIYGSVFLINPFLVSVELPQGSDMPVLYHDGRMMPRIDSLIVRSTYRLGDGLTATVRCLAHQGCDVLDPLTRQSRKGGSKLTTSISRFKGGVGSTTYLAFSRTSAVALAKRLAEGDRFPLITKPVSGRGGTGVVRLDSQDELLAHIERFYRRKTKATLLLQPFEGFLSEFRVILFFGKSLGIVRKIPAEGAVAANAAQGGAFVPTDRPDVEEYVCAKADRAGILGVDVGEKEDSRFRIIEANRAPKWETFDKTLNLDTARTIVSLACQRLS